MSMKNFYLNRLKIWRVNKKASVTDILNNISNKTKWEDLNEEELNLFNNTFIVNRFISMNIGYIELVNYLQYYQLPSKNLYKVYSDLLPARKISNRYIKKKKETFSSDLLDIISKYYECSVRETKDYLTILPKHEIESILSSLGYDDKTIKKYINNGK